MRVGPYKSRRVSRWAPGLAAAALIGLLATGCSGGGSSSGAAPVPGAPSAPKSPSGTAQVTFTMHWPAGSTSAVRRAPAYVPATARSVSISVNGGTPQYLNSPSSTLVIVAPLGSDTFTFQTYDEQNGQGNVLSRASVTQTILNDVANTVSATLNGVVAALTISLSNPSPNAGVPATVTVSVAAKDADGNTIVGAGDYSSPIQLAISDPSKSGTLTLSRMTVANPSTGVTLTYNGGTLNSGLPGGPTATIVASTSGVASVSVAFTPTPTFYQFSIPVSTNRPQWISAGSDGNMWFTESPGGKVARITPAGVVTEFTVPTANAQPQMIIGASDGNLWFTEYSTSPAPGTSKIAKVTTTGSFTEYSTLFAPPPLDEPLGLVDRGDGNIWYVANGSSRVGFQGISSGVAGETSVPTANSGPFGIATAPDNNLYYTEANVDKIGRITNLFTAQSEISLTSGSIPEAIVRGPDGNVWFTENGTSKIARLSPSSFAVTGEFPTATANAGPTGITVGQDGALWFSENGQDKIGRITTGGTVTEYASPVTGLGLRGIGVAPDGSLWFCEPGTGLSPGRIGKLVY
jgi:streptogramin lyase